MSTPLEVLHQLLSLQQSEIQRLTNENIAAWAVMTLLLQQVNRRDALMNQLRQLAATKPGPVEDHIMSMVMAAEGSNAVVSDQLKRFGQKAKPDNSAT